MNVTIGREYNTGKIAQVMCLTNDNLHKLQIKNECFLLLLITDGVAKFKIGNQTVTAAAPCFVCFDETENPILIKKSKLECQSIYFHPQFLNINMTFELIRSNFYNDIAHTHDMFLLKPFLDKCYVVPITESYLEKLIEAFNEMKNELDNQRDWYWSCRGRSYFMEIIIALERLYGLIGRGKNSRENDNLARIKNNRLKNVVLFMESHFASNISLQDIVAESGINHTTLTALMKEETGVTVMEYLQQYRVSVAKKQLAFTEIPIKDIANRCGFKTVQHFSRIFKEQTDKTPADFRKNAVTERKKTL